LKSPTIALFFIIAITLQSLSSTPAKKTPQNLSDSDSGLVRPVPEETLSVTQHSITLNDLQLRYTATAGRLPIDDSKGKTVASIFFTAYMRQPLTDFSKRPITFVFNGGPGASSVWLHLGIAGPRRVSMGQGTVLPPIKKMLDNRFTWLKFSDLVFVDPIGTGYSRAAPKVNPARFFTVDSDVAVIAEFIRLFLTRFERWTSPLFIAGESYGTTRSVVLTDYLQSESTIC
jgi:carboxypeptidase C (cathepsin A)